MTDMRILKISTLLFLIIIGHNIGTCQSFQWPDGKKMALSLSFDDSRPTAVDVGYPFLEKYDYKVTFFVMPPAVEKRLEGWKKIVAGGHEIGNHSRLHPCSGNFRWNRDNPLEEYTLERMHEELKTSNEEIEELLGVTPTVFAYPCGQMDVGRGASTQSYVPVVEELFLAGRTWMDEAAVDPSFCDMTRLTGIKMDNMDFEEILPWIERAKKEGTWLILAGHDIGNEGRQSTYISMLEDLFEYLSNSRDEIWTGTVGEIAEYLDANRTD